MATRESYMSAAERRAARPDDTKPRLSPLGKLEARAAEAEALALDAEIEAAKPSLSEAAKLARKAADAVAADIEVQQTDALEVVLRVNVEAAKLNDATTAALAAFIDAHEASSVFHETALAPAFRRARGLEVTGLPAIATVEVPGRSMPKDPVRFNEMVNGAVALVRKLQW